MQRFLVGIIAVVVAVACAVPVEAGFARAMGRKPLKGRYIVMLKDTPAEQVDVVADALARQFGGRLLGTMKYAMRGFGIALPEQRAIALSRHPLVRLVEEDEEVQLASEPAPFDFAATKRPLLTATSRKPTSTHHTTCAWNANGYYVCEYADDLYWHLDRLDNQGQIYGYKAYGYNTSGSTVRAYVVDSGVYATHDELVGRVEAGANMLWDPQVADPVSDPDGNEEEPIERDGYPADNPCGAWSTDPNAGHGHGTGVASVLGGRTSGVAKHVTIVPVKVIGCAGQSAKLAVARGLDWIQADMQGRTGTRAVVNMSMYFDTGYFPTEATDVCEETADENSGFTNCLRAVEHEINELIRNQIVVVVSANNQSQNRCEYQSPARLGYGNEANYASTYRTITVGGTMYTGAYVDERWTCAAQPGGCATYDELRNNPGSNHGPCVSVWAPAWNVQVAGAAGPTSYRTTFRHRSGTSFAAPYVAGVAARLLQRFPTLTPQQVWNEILTRTTHRWNVPDFDPSADIDNRRLVYMSATE